MRVRLWAMRTEPLTAAETELLLMGLPGTLRNYIRSVASRKRQQSLWAYSLLRYAMQTGYGLEMPEIVRDKMGKPHFCEKTEVFFNISHTEGAVLVGLSHRELGVDLEKERKAPVHLKKILQTEDAFFSAWVHWEACAKCRGVSVLSLLRKGVLPEDIAYQEVEVFPGYRAGAAVEGGEIAPEIQFVDSGSVLAWCKGNPID